MGFVKTPEEVKRIQHTLDTEVLRGETVSVIYASTPAAVNHVLPPGLEALDPPIVNASIKRYVTNYCGSFTMAGVYVGARSGDIVGQYMLTMFMDSYDAPLLIGREAGEPKKMGTVELFKERDHYVGWVDRNGTRLMTMNVDLGPDTGPKKIPTTLFLVNFAWSRGVIPPGNAKVFAGETILDSWVNREGTGTLTLGGTVHDPLHELEVCQVISATYSEAEFRAGTGRRFGVVAEISPEEYLPYHLGRLDDWSALNTLSLPA
jgi:acetoacetate decarboxylase